MINETKKIVIRRLESDGQFHIYFPQTDIEGFQDADEYVKQHWSDESVHVSESDRVNVFNKSIVLDESGHIPESILSKAKRLQVKDFANFTELKAAQEQGNVAANEYIMVLDASDKEEHPHSGWEVVLATATESGIKFEAVSSSQMVDYAINLANVENGTTSTSQQIDELVSNDHTHANLEILNSLTDEKFEEIAKKKDMTPIKYGENAIALENAEGDMVFNVTGIITE